jgi:hypothetical protein
MCPPADPEPPMEREKPGDSHEFDGAREAKDDEHPRSRRAPIDPGALNVQRWDDHLGPQESGEPSQRSGPVEGEARERGDVDDSHKGGEESDEGAEGEEDEVWFEADELERASEVQVGISHQALRARPVEGVLDELYERPWISLKSLPGWPGAPPTGGGWGELSRHVGGVRPGWVAVLTASDAGRGRSAFIHQISEGLARLDTEERGGILCPVAVLSEESELDVRARTLARWTGMDGRIFRGGRRGAAIHDLWGPDEVDAALEAGRRAFAGELALLGARQRFFHRDGRELGSETLEEACHQLATWRVRLGEELAMERERIWPVVVVDTLEAWSPRGAELETFETLVALCRREGWIALVSTRDPETLDRRGESLSDLRLHLDAQDAPGGTRLRARVERCRLGPEAEVAYSLDLTNGRVCPDSASASSDESD